MNQETEWRDQAERAGETVLKAPAGEELKSAEAAVAEEWQVADVILDLYEVKQVFTSGGMGLVYQVHHRNWNTDLVVKAPRAKYFQTEQHKENFRREAETWVNLGLHPHTVSCYYVRDLGGMPRVFAEYVEGGTLSDWIRSRKLYEGGKDEALKRILDIAIQFAWGLHYAHERGLVHQDVKPGNVMMTSNGVAKVTDFGLAKSKGGADAKAKAHKKSKANGSTQASRTILVDSGGLTPAYCSPEQADGKKLSRKTDIWSWAVSVLEMFTGEVTWRSGAFAAGALEAYADSPIEDPQIPSLPAAVAPLLGTCLQKNPAKRPPNMMEVATELQRLYEVITSRAFHRTAPKAVKGLADNLNNRAVSMIDLGKHDAAIEVLDEAVRVKPGHINATYNRGLLSWRTGEQDDVEFVQQLWEAQRLNADDPNGNYLLALADLERGAVDSAIRSLESVELERRNDELQKALSIAQERQPLSRSLVRKLQDGEGRAEPITLSQDGRYCLANHTVMKTSMKIKLWDLQTGDCLHTTELMPGADDDRKNMHVATLSNDGRYVLFLKGPMVNFWSLETEEVMPVLEGDWLEIGGAHFNVDGRYVVSRSGTWHQDVKVWDVASGTCIRTLTEGSGRPVDSFQIAAFAITPNGDRVITGLHAGAVKVFNVTTGNCVRVFEGHKASIERLAVSPDGSLIASHSTDEIKIWDANSGGLIQTIATKLGTFEDINFSNDNRFLATAAGHGSMLKLWEIDAPRCLRTYNEPQIYSVRYSISADGRFAVSGGDELSLWRLDGRDYVAPFSLSRIVASETASEIEAEYDRNTAAAREALAEGDYLRAATFANQARSLPNFERASEVISIAGELCQHLPRKSLRGGWEVRSYSIPGMVGKVKFSHARPHAVCRNQENELLLWNIEDGSLLSTLTGHTKNPYSLYFSDNGQYLLSGGSDEDETVRFWDVATGRCLRTLEQLGFGTKTVALSPDGRLAAAHLGGTFWLWETATGRFIHEFSGLRVSIETIRFTHDGRYLLTGGRGRENRLRLWDVITGRCLRAMNDPLQEGESGEFDGIYSIAPSFDGRYALSGAHGQDSGFKLWDIELGECVRHYQGYPPNIGVSDLALTVDGRFAAVSADDRTVKVWDIHSGGCLRTFTGHTDSVSSIGFSPDGRFLISGGEDVVRVWYLDWELGELEPVEWDDKAAPYLDSFLLQQMPYVYRERTVRTRRGKTRTEWVLERETPPQWNEAEFQTFISFLQGGGLGWLTAEGVRQQLDARAADWEALVDSQPQHVGRDDEDDDDPELHVERGLELLKAGELVAALSSFERALALDPVSVPAWTGRATAQLRLQKLTESLESCDRAIKLEPKNSVAWLIRGEVLYKFGRYEESITSCEQGLALNPSLVEAAATLARALRQLQRFEESISAYENALRIDPADPTLWAGRGEVLHKAHRAAEALKSFDRAIELNPDTRDAWFNKGLVLLSDAARRPEALTCFQQALRLKHPQAAKMLEQYGPARQLEERAQIEENVESERTDRGAGVGDDQIASAPNQLASVASAAPLKVVVLAREPYGGGEASHWRAEALNSLESSEWRRAIDCYRRALEEDPDHGMAWLGLGAALVNSGQHEDALLAFERAHELGEPQARELVSTVQRGAASNPERDYVDNQ